MLAATKTTEQNLGCRFATRAEIAETDVTAFRVGCVFGDTESFISRYEVAAAKLPEGRNRTLPENLALTYRLLIGARSAGRPLFLCADPITPALDLLYELARHKSHGVPPFQAEYEGAAIAAAVGASFGGHVVVTSTSGRHRLRGVEEH
ncbi:hypothetical protein ACWPOB_03255 [Rhodococcus sp. 2H158]|nr:hypothetical protein GQ85_03985 [Rhodococcus rhodochrous]